ncbi:thioesterase family protein [Rhodococcus tukisamuensis]|uniref:Thioesterase-like superfamily protein n=1 Tax=Rhodococcus tukisamuensis TaxID=168276 RepID=A0A1G6YYZ2_9NOCA|nr:thioesterase family protein [Rhodococcus tukisamuensis]SDD95531.1 Thioesterase-like superfamily protein [Rhodococcus tukisamuensis]
MPDQFAFFATTEDGYVPLPFATSRWSEDMVHGAALCGLLARAVENGHGAEGFTPARLTVDLFRPALTRPFTTTTASVREGRRIRVADAELWQDGEVVARASAVFLRRSEQPPGEVWTREHRPSPPDAGPVDELRPPWFGSDDHPEGWSSSMLEHQGASRKRMWSQNIPVVEGEELSPFVRAAMAAEPTSLMTNWGTAGVGFINVDLTMVLSRLPDGPEVGLEADDHHSADGIAAGTATLFDRGGPIGTCVVSALANAQRQVDFSGQGEFELPIDV